MLNALTVLLPVKNGGDYLSEALESLSAQTFGDWTCLALDDGSTDRTREILEAHANRDRRFSIVCRDESLGLPGALNFLLSRVETEWFARMDADDVCGPKRLELQAAATRADPEVALWGARVDPLGEASPGWRAYLDWANGIRDDDAIRQNAFTECPLPHPTWLGRVRDVREAGGYRDGPFPEDYELFLRLLGRGARFGKVSSREAALGWRDHPSRETWTHSRYGFDAILRLKAARFPALLRAGRLPGVSTRPVAVWGAGKTGKIAARELALHGLSPECFLDPMRPGVKSSGIPVLAPEASPPGRHLVLVAVRPRKLRAELTERFASEGRQFGRDWLWFY